MGQSTIQKNKSSQREEFFLFGGSRDEERGGFAMTVKDRPRNKLWLARIDHAPSVQLGVKEAVSQPTGSHDFWIFV